MPVILITIIKIKFVLVAFMLVSALLIKYRANKYWFLLLVGFSSAIAYAFMVNNSELLFWGLQGDEITISAMFNTFAHVGFLSDFAYHGLAPFYPPLYFWIFALIGKAMNWNGVMMAKFAAFSAFLIFPVLLYQVQKIIRVNNSEDDDGPSEVAFFLFPMLILAMLETDIMIGKSYEIISAALTVVWATYLLLAVQSKNLIKKNIVSFVILGAVIFMSYYLWLIFAAIAVCFYALFANKWQIKNYLRLALIGALILICSSPYLAPLIMSYSAHGTESWQTAFITARGLADTLPLFFDFNYVGLLSLLGLSGLFYFRNNKYLRPALFLYFAAYVWWMMGLATVFFFNAPIQEFKGFHVYERVILAFALSYMIDVLWRKTNVVANTKYRQLALFIGLIFLATCLPFGKFINDPLAQERIEKSKAMPGKTKNLINYLRVNNSNDDLTLHSGLAEIPAFVPINTYIYFNQHNSNPAANFSSRKAYLYILANAKNDHEFNELTKTPFGEIRRLIFYQNKGNYLVYFHVDSPGDGIKEEVVKIPKKLITTKYFEKKYDDKEFVVWVKK